VGAHAIRRVVIASLAIAAVAACGASPSPAPPTVFVATIDDFRSFRSWPSMALTVEIAPGNDHLSGPRRVFINKRPPGGTSPFPIGTIVLKESGDGDPTTRDVFAMVKRGGDFNASGAIDWEWFQLKNGADGSVTMLWRGVGPANGDAYGSDTTGGCNTCHQSAASQDFIFTADLGPLLSP
jgi:hypothetical protein